MEIVSDELVALYNITNRPSDQVRPKETERRPDGIGHCTVIASVPTIIRKYLAISEDGILEDRAAP